jgi:segregation and condensation protein B
MKDKAQIRNTIEAALFSAEEPLSVRDLQSMFSGACAPQPEDIQSILDDLTTDYAGRGIELVRVANGFRFQTRQSYAQALRKLRESRPPRYSKALLETLAIIAYRQPVTRGDIEEVRGVGVSTDIMRVLLERDWVRQVGSREVPGRPALYSTTAEFLEYFNLDSVKELPDLAEQRDIGEIARELNIILPEPVTPAGDDDDVEDPILPDRYQDAEGQNLEPSSEINDTAESEDSMRTAADGGG